MVGACKRHRRWRTGAAFLLATALLTAAAAPAPTANGETVPSPSPGPSPAPFPGPQAATPEKPPDGEVPVFSISPDKVVAVLGQQVVGPLGTALGRLVDVLVNKDGVPEAAVIDFGGFLGVGSRKIAVHWNTLHFNPGDAKYPIVLDLMPAQIKGAPGYKGESKPAPVVVAPWEPPAAAAPASPPAAPAAPAGSAAKPAAPQ